jgi:hypothetical protein
MKPDMKLFREKLNEIKNTYQGATEEVNQELNNNRELNEL